jgi:hypothetical protein
MLGIAVGGKTMKMHQGHHGANHPVKDLTTGKVEITSMNHGFAVDKESLPKNVEQTHFSLFDGSNCGMALKDRPVFSVQYHPEASPGPRDSHYCLEATRPHILASIMPGFMPGIHVLGIRREEDVDGRDKPGHDIMANPFTRPALFRHDHREAPHLPVQGRRQGAEQSCAAGSRLQGRGRRFCKRH